MRVLVGSQNPVKIEAAREAFSRYFPDVEVVGIDSASNVSSEPVEDEVFKGARNRALHAKKISEQERLGADYFVGIEGGIAKRCSRWFGFGGVCIIDKDGREGYGTSPHFPLPEKIVDELLSGTELGIITDRLAGERNTKQKHGAVGFFTKGVMGRKDLYVSGLIVALAPFVSKDVYFSK